LPERPGKLINQDNSNTFTRRLPCAVFFYS
jgi:hypothetical protein